MTPPALPRDLLVAQMAVRTQRLTQAQLDECLALQSQSPTPRPSLTAVLRARGYLTPEQIADIERMVVAQGNTTRVADPDPLVGKTLSGEFRLIRLLGQGGMGSVYLGEQLSLSRKVAIKILPPTVGESADSVARFQREARAAARLQHPNIVHVYFFGQEETLFFIGMEYVDGETLLTRLEREGVLPVAETLRIAKEVALALAAAHKHGFVHRDVKPDNIFLGVDGSVKLGDFGLARDMYSSGSVSASGTVMGTPNYMAPEQGQGKKVDGRADLYALGATLFHVLAGRRPY